MRFFCLVSVLLLTACDDYNYVIVDHGQNFIAKDGVEVVPNFIVEYERGAHHIAVTRLKVNAYRCREAFDGKYYDSANEKITKNIEYRVINTDTGRVYITEDRSKYIRYLFKHKIKHLLTTGRYEDAPFRRNEKLKRAFEVGDAYLEKDILMKKCKFVAEYSG
jgi:hypothetical protein